MFKATFLFAILVIATGDDSHISIVDNGYKGVVVAISPNINETEGLPLISKIEDLFKEASAILYSATRKHVFFKEITILIPHTWSKNSTFKPATYESFGSASVRIDTPNPYYLDGPYTLQALPCGNPGLFIHLTPNYLRELRGQSTALYGKPGKTLVHEWAHLRFGIFDEFGGGVEDGDLFPRFYYNEFENLVPNQCSNTKVEGIYMDSKTQGPCVYGVNGLPNNDCIFVPNMNENSNVNSSLASFHFLPNVSMFCDDTTHKHNVRAPNKHNLLCDYASTWSIISQHTDIKGKIPGPVRNTTPVFKYVQQIEATFALVLDVSNSMGENSPYTKFDMLIDSATRWLKYDVKEGTSVGIISFAEKEKHLAEVTKITSQAVRQDLIKKLPTRLDGWTCIGCGLRGALKDLYTYRNGNGGTIIVLTDGDENKTPFIETELPKIVAQEVRVIAIALQTDKSEKLELAASSTGGKLFNVPKGSSIMELGTVFYEATTYQSTDIDVSVKVHDFFADNKSNITKENFTIDSTVGANTIVKIVYLNRADINTININGPGLNVSLKNATIQEDDLRFIMFEFTRLQPGTYSYNINRKGASNNRIAVTVSSSSIDKTKKPIATRTWIAVDNKKEGTPRYIIYAEVKQGNNPIINAAVLAMIDRPNDKKPVTVQLFDNGAEPDVTRDDGIYCSYFTRFAGKGRYSVKAQVTDDGKAAIRENGFIASRSMPIVSAKLAAQSVTTTKPTNSFVRVSDSATITVDDPRLVETDTSDFYPPSKVQDLRLETGDSNNVTLLWTAPGDELTEGTVTSYEIQYSNVWSDLYPIFNGAALETGNFTPQEAGNEERYPITIPLEVNVPYYFALRSTDKSNKTSKVSNVVEFKQTVPTVAEDYTITIVAVVLSLVLVGVIVFLFVKFSLHKKIQNLVRGN